MAVEQVELVRKPSPPKGTNVIFGIEGRRGSVRFSKTLFDTAPDKVIVQVDGLAAAKRKETKEERKVRLAAMPKATPEQKLAKLQEKANRLAAKIAAGKQ